MHVVNRNYSRLSLRIWSKGKLVESWVFWASIQGNRTSGRIQRRPTWYLLTIHNLYSSYQRTIAQSMDRASGITRTSCLQTPSCLEWELKSTNFLTLFWASYHLKKSRKTLVNYVQTLLFKNSRMKNYWASSLPWTELRYWNHPIHQASNQSLISHSFPSFSDTRCL